MPGARAGRYDRGASGPSGEIGRRTGLKILWRAISVRVRFPPRPLFFCSESRFLPGKPRFPRGSGRFRPRRVTCCESLQWRASPGNASPVRRTRRCLAGASPARRSPRHRSGVPSTHVEAAFNGPRPRAHRRLKQDVTVYRLVSRGTIEERILERQRAKQSLADEGFFRISVAGRWRQACRPPGSATTGKLNEPI